MKKLLVGSVYAPDVRNETWLSLQHRFLERTVGDYDHCVILNRVDPELFGDTLVLRAVPPSGPQLADELTGAMDEFMSYFISRPDYEYYLLIDSDAFPFVPGWIETLCALMEAKPEHGLSERQFASPVRCENLDRFPHGCAFFAKGEWFRTRDPERFSWEYMPAQNFMGAPSKDITIKDSTSILGDAGEQVWLPLMRTNTVNLHPILGAVYGHAFYHHGAGSRIPQFRAIMQGAYDNFADQSYTDKRNIEMFDALRRDPDGYVQHLIAEQGLSRKRSWW